MANGAWNGQAHKRKRRQSRESDVFFSASHNMTETAYQRRVDELTTSHRDFLRQHKRETWEIHRSLGALRQTDSLAFADERRKVNFHLAAVKARREFAAMPSGVLKREPKLMDISELQQWYDSRKSPLSESVTGEGEQKEDTSASPGKVGIVPGRRNTFPVVSKAMSSPSKSEWEQTSYANRRRSSASGILNPPAQTKHLEPIADRFGTRRLQQRSKTSIGSYEAPK